MNMRYAMRSEDTEQINVVSWANWNMNRYPELKWLHHVPNGGSRNKQEAVKVIEEYCKLMNHKMGDCEIVIPLENREELRNITMSIPNNSILKNGEIKESKPRKK